MDESIASSTALYVFIRNRSNAKVSKIADFFIIRLIFNYKTLYQIGSEPSRKMMGNVRVGSFYIKEGLLARILFIIKNNH